MFQKIAKHRANDASHDVHRTPLQSRGKTRTNIWYLCNCGQLCNCSTVWRLRRPLTFSQKHRHPVHTHLLEKSFSTLRATTWCFSSLAPTPPSPPPPPGPRPKQPRPPPVWSHRPQRTTPARHLHPLRLRAMSPTLVRNIKSWFSSFLRAFWRKILSRGAVLFTDGLLCWWAVMIMAKCHARDSTCEG